MGTKVFKQEIWSKQITNQLSTLTGMRKHSDYSYEGEIKGGAVLKITGAVRPTVGNYIPGTDITFEPVKGNVQDLRIDIFKYATQTFDDVDRAQSIPGVMENATREMAKELGDAMDKEVAEKIKAAITAGVSFTGESGTATVVNVPQETTATDVTKANALTRIDDGVQALQENNVPTNEEIWGEFSPKYYKFVKQNLLNDLTQNKELAKKGIVGQYSNVNITIENLLPVDTVKKEKYNILRTGKAVAYAEQLSRTKAGEHEKQFGEYVKALMVAGCKVVRPTEMFIIKEKTA